MKRTGLKRVYLNLGKFLIYVLIIASIMFLSYPRIVKAAPLTAISDVLTRIKAATLSSHDILFTLGGSTALDAGETVAIDFGEDDSKFVVAGATTVAGDLDFNDGTERVIYNVGSSTDCTGSVGVNDLSVGINDTTGVVTFLACPSFTSSGSGAIINVEYGTAAAGGTNRVTNPNPGGPPQTYVLSVSAAGDSGSFALVIIADDQVLITATVDPSITFTVSATSSAFGSIPVGSVDTSSPNITLTVGTNAENGYAITVQDEGSGVNPGLYNSSASTIIGSADSSYIDEATLSGGTEGYGIQGSSAQSTIAARYDKSGNNVGGLERTATGLASFGTGTTSDHSITITHKAAISSSTKAGSYNDTLTYIATGNF